MEDNLYIKTPTQELKTSQDNLVNDIVKETDSDKLNDLTQLFELNQRKKNIVRVNKLSNLLEVVDDEVITRLSTTPEDFDNELLLKYMQSTQRSINEIQDSMHQTPLIQINNQKNEININNSLGGNLDQDSRKRVMDAVIQIINNSKEIETTADLIDEENTDET